MAFPTSVNDQVTDSVTQANLEVLGMAGAQATGVLMQSVAQALANTAHNATQQQLNGEQLAQAVLARSLQSLLGKPHAA